MHGMFKYYVPVFYTLLQIITLISIGWILKRYGKWPENFFTTLSTFLIRLALPIYLFIIVSKTDYTELGKSWMFFAAAIGMIFTGLGLSRLAAMPLASDRSDKRLISAFSGFNNAGYIPLSIVEIMPLTMPVLYAYFGTRIPSFYISLYVLCQSPLLWTLGNYLVTGRGRRPKLQEMLSPPVVGIVLGLLFLLPGIRTILLDERLPVYHVYIALSRFGNIAIPLLLVCLGTMIADLKVDRGTWKGFMKLALPVMGMRFLVMPGVFFLSYFLIFRPAGFSPAQCFVIFLESGSPPATNLSLMASRAGINENKVAFVILVTYIFYLLVLPVYLLLFLSLPGILGGS